MARVENLPETVALRKESVDRNTGNIYQDTKNNLSLSARRAWIEIAKLHVTPFGGVGRSPQGERG